MGVPSIVYKYLPPSRIDVLRDARIRFTQANALNDPFELRAGFSRIFEPQSLKHRVVRKLTDPNELSALYESLSEDLKNRLPLSVFVHLIPWAVANKDKELLSVMDAALATFEQQEAHVAELLHERLDEILQADVGILSLTADPVNELMWAHYGASHAGFLIGFRADHPFFDRRRSVGDEFFYLRQVIYEDFTELSLEQLTERGSMFIRKTRAWAYESEWRMLIPLAGRQPELTDPELIHLVPYPKETVCRVLIGCRAAPDFRKSLVRLLQGDPAFRKVELFQVRADSGRRLVMQRA